MISLPIEHWLGGEAVAKGAGRGKTTLLGLTLVRLYGIIGGSSSDPEIPLPLISFDLLSHIFGIQRRP